MIRPATLLIALSLLAAPALRAADAKPLSESDITKQLGKLRDTPNPQRDADTARLALAIRALPAGPNKVRLADGLTHLATEADPSRDTIQAFTTTLADALKESPLPGKNDKPAAPYLDLARLVRYLGATTNLTGPELDQANAILAANDAEIDKADFTLLGSDNKKVTLSQLRGKIVLVNFWATWCPPCRKEMPDLNAIYLHYKNQGLVILSITDEDIMKVNSFIEQAGYRYPILFDTQHKASKQFHIDSIPPSFVFDREGKMVARSIDACSQQQFFNMLAKAGLTPQ